MTRTRRVLAGLALIVTGMAGCAPTDVRPVGASAVTTPLPKPDRVLVHDFVVSPDDVRLNSGPGARLLRRLSGAPVSEEQAKIGRRVAASFSEELVKAIREMGLPADRASQPATIADRTLAVEGQFVAIDEGNRAERLVIGFGAGGTAVSAIVQVYMGMPSGPLLIREFETKAESSRKPGAAATMGAGAAVGAGVAVAGATSGALETQAGVEADARRTARELGKQLRDLFERQGWIPAR